MTRLPLALAALALATLPACAGDIEVQHAWLRATPKGAPVAGGYATIVNHGSVPDRLVGASIAGVPNGEVHEMSMTNGVMHMARLADGLAIAPGATVSLTPGGYHLMFEKPTAQLKQGQSVTGSLSFAKAGKIAVTFAVAGIGARSAPGTGPMKDMSMKDMPMKDMPGMKMDH